MFFQRSHRETLFELARDGRGWVLLTVALGWFLSFGVRLVFPAMLPYLRGEFGMSLGTAGFLITALWLAYGFGQLPGGMIGDHIGARTTLTLSTVIAALTVVIVVVSKEVWMVFVGTVFFGLATAPYGPVRLVVLSSTYPSRDGTAIGLTFAAGNLGTTVLPILATGLATYLVWYMGFIFVVPLFGVAAIGLWSKIPADTDDEEVTDVVISSSFFRRLLRATTRRPILLAAGVSLFSGFAYQGLTGLYPTYLVEVKGLSPNVAATLLGILFATGMVYQALSGAVLDRVGPGATLTVVLVVASTALFALPFVESLPGLALLTGVLACLLGYQPVVQTYLASSIPTGMRGSGLGLIRTIAFMVGATAPVTVGLFAERGFFDEAFLLLGGAAVVGLVLSVRLDDGSLAEQS